MLRQTQDQEMQDFADRQSTLQAASIADNTAGAVGSAGMAISYSGFFANYFNHPYGSAITGLGSYILFPMILLTGAVEAVCSWMYTLLDRRKRDNKLKTRNILNSIVSTASFVGFGIAIIASLAAAATFGLAVPIIFMSVISARILFNIGAAIYWGCKSAAVKPESDTPAAIAKANTRADKYSTRAKEHAKGAALGVASLAATTAVFLLGYFVLAPIGIAVNLIFLGLSIAGIVKGVKNFVDKRKQAAHAAKATPAEKYTDEPDIQPSPKVSRDTKKAPASPSFKRDKDDSVRRPLLSKSVEYKRNWSTDTGIFTVSGDEHQTEARLAPKRNPSF